MDVEEHYRKRVDAMSAVERVRRATELARWSREFLYRRIAQETPGLPDRAIRLGVALRLYGADPRMAELIRESQDRVRS